MLRSSVLMSVLVVVIAGCGSGYTAPSEDAGYSPPDTNGSEIVGGLYTGDRTCQVRFWDVYGYSAPDTFVESVNVSFSSRGMPLVAGREAVAGATETFYAGELVGTATVQIVDVTADGVVLRSDLTVSGEGGVLRGSSTDIFRPLGSLAIDYVKFLDVSIGSGLDVMGIEYECSGILRR